MAGAKVLEGDWGDFIFGGFGRVLRDLVGTGRVGVYVEKRTDLGVACRTLESTKFLR